MTWTDGEIYHVLGLEESILSEWLYYSKQPTDSIQSLSKLPKGIFHRTRTKTFTICMEIQMTWNSKAILRKKKKHQNWRNCAPWLQTILQSYSHQDSTVLGQKQKHRPKYRPMEQDRKPRDKPTHLWSTNPLQMKQEYTMEKKSLQ